MILYFIFWILVLFIFYVWPMTGFAHYKCWFYAILHGNSVPLTTEQCCTSARAYLCNIHTYIPSESKMFIHHCVWVKLQGSIIYRVCIHIWHNVGLIFMHFFIVSGKHNRSDGWCISKMIRGWVIHANDLTMHLYGYFSGSWLTDIRRCVLWLYIHWDLNSNRKIMKLRDCTFDRALFAILYTYVLFGWKIFFRGNSMGFFA